MATAPQEGARALRAALARPSAAARAPRTDETATVFPGLLAVSLAQTPPPNLLGQAVGGGPDAAVTAQVGWPFAAGPAGSTAPAVPLTGRRQSSDGAAAVATAAPRTPVAAPAAPPTTEAGASPPTPPAASATTPPAASPPTPPGASPVPATVAMGSTDPVTYAPGPAASPPAVATPRQSLADAWLAANLGLATVLAPFGQASASPLPGGVATAAAVADAAGAVGQPGGDVALPATVSRQVTIQLLKQSGDATAPGGRLTLRLDPPQLGRIEVSFEQRGDRLLVTLTAQTPEAERALRNGAGELQQALAGAGGKWQDAQVKIELAPGRDEPRPDGDDGDAPGEQPSRRRQARDDG